MERKQVTSDSIWEQRLGYSRAVRTGPFVFVSGKSATDDDGNVTGEGEPYKQTITALDKIGMILSEADASLSDVVRTRLYLTDIDHWEDVGEAHAEVFSDIRPATTMVEVSQLVSPEILVEIEATAIVADYVE